MLVIAALKVVVSAGKVGTEVLLESQLAMCGRLAAAKMGARFWAYWRSWWLSVDIVAWFRSFWWVLVGSSGF